MRFKVGDKVKFVKSTISHTDDVKIGETYKIIEIAGHDVRYQVKNKEWFKEEELQKVEYTFEDLRKSPIGTKIVFEKLKDELLIRTSEKKFENECYRFYIRDLENLCTRDFGKIIKIEEPEYRTVYENESEILDEVEKRYLRGVIRPFRNRVKAISLITSGGKGYCYINIELKDENIYLPNFEINTMYKGMKPEKKYGLEELGI